MNTALATKSRCFNTLEGLTLSAVFTHMPTFAAASMLLKFADSQTVANFTGGAVGFVAVTSIMGAVMSAWLGRKFPRFFGPTYQPLFFDTSLTLKEKLLHWQAQPKITSQLVTVAIMLSVVGTALASIK